MMLSYYLQTNRILLLNCGNSKRISTQMNSLIDNAVELKWKKGRDFTKKKFAQLAEINPEEFSNQPKKLLIEKLKQDRIKKLTPIMEEIFYNGYLPEFHERLYNKQVKNEINEILKNNSEIWLKFGITKPKPRIYRIFKNGRLKDIQKTNPELSREQIEKEYIDQIPLDYKNLFVQDKRKRDLFIDNLVDGLYNRGIYAENPSILDLLIILNKKRGNIENKISNLMEIQTIKANILSTADQWNIHFYDNYDQINNKNINWILTECVTGVKKVQFNPNAVYFFRLVYFLDRAIDPLTKIMDTNLVFSPYYYTLSRVKCFLIPCLNSSQFSYLRKLLNCPNPENELRYTRKKDWIETIAKRILDPKDKDENILILRNEFLRVIQRVNFRYLDT